MSGKCDNLTCCSSCGDALDRFAGSCACDDKAVMLALGIIFFLGIIGATVACAMTTTTRYDFYGYPQTYSNVRYLPIVIIGGGYISAVFLAAGCRRCP